MVDGLEEMLEAYRKQVEREFAEALASLFGLVAESYDQKIETAERFGLLQECVKLRAGREAVTEAVASIKVMGGIEL